jgi:two-component system response regulator PilR (NtrC family)
LSKQERILVVDDDIALQESLVKVLETEGYYVDTAKTGREAEVKLKSRYFNIALLDIRLPDITGIELLSKMNIIAPKTIKIMLTGYPDASSAISALNEKADAYIVKPVNPEELLELISVQIKQQVLEMKFTQEKVLEYIHNKVKEMDNYL